MPRRAFLSILGLALLASTAAGTDTVILTNGGEIRATILKADDSAVVVDLGSEVLRLPRSEVARIVRADAEAGDAQEATSQPETESAPAWRLYRTAELSPTTIEVGSERYGEAVVMVTTPGGLGSGFIINPEGYLITNYHVIANETRIKITVFRRTEKGYEPKHYKKVKIVAMNPFVDLALLKIEEAESPLKYAYLGDPQRVTVGEQVYAIGNPLGLTRTVSQGIVSTRNRNFEGQIYVQTTTAINPGNSGGPLFNLRGEIIGVTSMGYLYLGGLNFAIPIDVVKRFLDNRDAFAYDEDNPNAGYRYLQPGKRVNAGKPPLGRVPVLKDGRPGKAIGTDRSEL
jgi:serine protease Do